MRNVLVIMVGVLWYKEKITYNEGVGYSIALVGFAGYVYVFIYLYHIISFIRISIVIISIIFHNIYISSYYISYVCNFVLYVSYYTVVHRKEVTSNESVE